jgi:GNAT superfamily N-acetyltransferase
LVEGHVERVPVGILPAGARLTVATYVAQPRHPGWKCELLDGIPRIEPRAATVPVRLALADRRPVHQPPRLPPPGVAVRPVAGAADAPALVRAVAEAFLANVDFWGCGRAYVRGAVEDTIATFFAGRRGVVHPASRLAVTARAVVGGAPLVCAPKGPRLDLLFVRPRWRHRGLATLLVAEAATVLRASGAPVLRSRYRLANVPSAAWHARFGFVEEPDWLVAQAREGWGRHELRRLERLQQLDARRRAALEADVRRWTQQQRALAVGPTRAEDDD